MEQDRTVQYRKTAKSSKKPNENASFEVGIGHNNYSDRSFRAPRPRLKYLIPQEIRALLAATAKSPRDHAIFRLAYHYGLRASEVGLISMMDYHPGPRMENDRLTIHRVKGSVGGEVRILPAAAEAIRRWIKRRGSQPGPMFPSQRQTPISRQRLDELIKMYGRKAGIPEDKRHFHVLRHSCATSLLSEFHEDIAHVQNHLGHKNIQNTAIYAAITQMASDERFQRLRSWR